MVAFSWLWIPITVFAAFVQNIRSAAQKHLTSGIKYDLGNDGSVSVRTSVRAFVFVVPQYTPNGNVPRYRLEFYRLHGDGRCGPNHRDGVVGLSVFVTQLCRRHGIRADGSVLDGDCRRTLLRRGHCHVRLGRDFNQRLRCDFDNGRENRYQRRPTADPPRG